MSEKLNTFENNQSEDFDFEKAYNASFKDFEENTIITANVVDISSDVVFLDFGYKSEAKLATNEFDVLPKIGDEIEVYLVMLEGRNGTPVVSKKKCDYLHDKNQLRETLRDRKPVKGVVKEIKKEGCIVEYKTMKGFIPISLFDFDRNVNLKNYLNKEINFYIERINFKESQFSGRDKKDDDFVGNRKKYLYEKNNIMRETFFDDNKEGDILEGTVKSITDFGAFIDLGGIDALLRNKDMAWTRINNASDIIKEGDNIKVSILQLDKENRKVTVGLKQLQDDPWDKFVVKYKIDDVIVGSVVSIAPYGAFVKVIDGVEGLLHISDMSWVKKIKNPTELVEVGQNLELKIIKIDQKNRKVSLSLKHLLDNPWDKAKDKYKIGEVVAGKVKTITTFGVFVELEEGIDALLHIDDVSWTETIRNPHEHFKIDDEIKGVVTQFDSKKAKIKISIKDMTDDPWKKISEKYNTGDMITCKINKIEEERGLLVNITDEITSFIPLSHIGFGRRDELKGTLKDFNEGDDVNGVIVSLDNTRRKINISIKEYNKKKEREKVEIFLHDENEDVKYTLEDAIQLKEDNK